MNAVDRFAELAAGDEGRIDLARAATAIALDEYPELEIEETVTALDRIADEARATVSDDARAVERITQLNHFFFTERGFRGNADDYYDPRNSFLNDVLERRLGIPITLSVIYMEVARRLDLSLRGVGFPGHFLARFDGPEEILIDAYAGRIVTREDLKRRIRATHGQTARLDSSWLRAASSTEILIRMLRNLKGTWMRRGEPARAIGMSHRILILIPDDAEEIRDRGALYLKLDYPPGALADFERYLELVPEGHNSRRIRAALPGLRQQVVSLQ